MTQTMTSISAVDYFKAKLEYEMSPWGLKQHLDKGGKDYLVLDVRSKEDYAKGRLPGAKSLPLTDFPGQLGSLPKDKTIVTYCANYTCQLAPRAALELAQKGFKVMELHGGIAEWTAKGFPVEK